MLSQAQVETELTQRFKSALGTFTSDPDRQRLRLAYLDALRRIWVAKEWRFKNQSSTLTTTTAQGTGPYTPPTGLYKLAQTIGIYRFTFDDAQILAPVKDTTTATYFLWIDGVTGDLYFASAPGDASLTLNFQGEFDNDVENVADTITLFPSSCMAPLYHLTKANLYEDLPQFQALADGERQKGISELEMVWQDYNQGQARQRQMAPRALHGARLDGYADPVPLNGSNRFLRRN